jgi:hypothetical protein
MKYYRNSVVIGLALSLFGLFIPKLVFSQIPAKVPPITFNNFNATYHLSRDATNHSLLTTEEVILADFPSQGNYFGITRSVPQSYQGRSVKVKVNSVTDAGGNPVPFKTAADKLGNLVVTTGDPGITIFGLQTFHINYQTRDVVNTDLATDQFLLDVNGRGWDQPFSQVSGTIHIPKSFASSLIGKPNCYIGYLRSTSADCSINTQTNASETVITVKSQGPVVAHHALVAKINFHTATFSVKQGFWNRYWGYIIVPMAVLLVIGWYLYTRRIIQ